MKTLFNHPTELYIIAGIACLCIMIIIDFILGPEAEHLNAWVIVNRLLGREIPLTDSLAIQRLGLGGATFLMLAINGALGIFLIQGLKLFIKLIHS